MFWRSVFFLAVTAVVACFASEQRTFPDATSFSFYDFFSGEWDVQQSTTSLKQSTFKYAPVLGRYKVDKVNGTSGLLLGRSYENNTATGEISSRAEIKIEFDSPNAGRFLVGASDFSLDALFDFDFVQHYNNMAVSQGRWKGEAGAFYSFWTVGNDRFVLTVYPKETTDVTPLVVFIGRKIESTPQAEKGFLGKYGTYFALAIFVILRFVFNQRSRRTGAGASRPTQQPKSAQLATMQRALEAAQKQQQSAKSTAPSAGSTQADAGAETQNKKNE